jgi:hypothetical protein
MSRSKFSNKVSRACADREFLTIRCILTSARSAVAGHVSIVIKGSMMGFSQQSEPAFRPRGSATLLKADERPPYGQRRGRFASARN